MSVTLINKFTGHPGKGDDVLAWLAPAAKGFPSAPGCDSAYVMRNTENPDEIISVEVWDSIEAHQTFMKSMQEGGMEDAMKTLASQPEGEYFATV